MAQRSPVTSLLMCLLLTLMLSAGFAVRLATQSSGSGPALGSVSWDARGALHISAADAAQVSACLLNLCRQATPEGRGSFVVALPQPALGQPLRIQACASHGRCHIENRRPASSPR